MKFQGMDTIQLHCPGQLVFGSGCVSQMVEDCLALRLSRLFILTVSFLTEQLSPLIDQLKAGGISIEIDQSIEEEPDFNDFKKIRARAKDFKPDGIVGIGGGSVMDMAKIIAAMVDIEQPIESIVENGLLQSRTTCLVCVPTTSGTGSEVSPNSILIDHKDGSKKGIISPFLVPDRVYIDPALTLSVPPDVTAYTGIDALTHCIEAYANKFAHPMTDTLALEGIRLISRNLKKAVNNGQDMEARSNMALASMYGGMCLGPVNTAAVHALAYPLSTMFKIPHGLSNAVLLPYVMEFNLTAAKERYAEIAISMGIEKKATEKETALEGINCIKTLLKDCSIPASLSALGVTGDAVRMMAGSALEVQRLLKNNVREVTLEDAITIYKTAC